IRYVHNRDKRNATENAAATFTKECVNFVELKEGVIQVKFGAIEDRTRILNLSPWLFDQCLFAMLPYVKDQDLDTYAFNISPFWLRIFNIPLVYMDRQVAIDVGKAIGKLLQKEQER
ncbi:hypothetical protein Gotri_015604, partial [Gossypium trilobum]|nr:hypothetical protein [Gossypium trilobum]